MGSKRYWPRPRNGGVHHRSLLKLWIVSTKLHRTCAVRVAVTTYDTDSMWYNLCTTRSPFDESRVGFFLCHGVNQWMKK